MSWHVTLVVFIVGLVLMGLGFLLLRLAWRLRFARAARLVFDAEEERDLAWVFILFGNAMAMVGGLLQFGADASWPVYSVVLALVPMETIAAVWLRIRARRATFEEFGELQDDTEQPDGQAGTQGEGVSMDAWYRDDEGRS